MNKKNSMWMTRFGAILMVAGALSCPAARAASDEMMTDEELLEEGLTRKEEPFEVSLGALGRAYTFEHNALQVRADRHNDNSENWRDGDVDGGGWGLVFAVSRQSSKIYASLVSSDYDYNLDYSAEDYEHDIETSRRDFELGWEEMGGNSDRARWGWLLGARYITLDERFTIREHGDELSHASDIKWFMAQGGYWGKVEPFRQPFMNVYGNAKLLLGEVSGLARSGSDDAIDGDIDEIYEDEFSLAYGVNGTVGLAFRIRKLVGLNIEYFREYLYSFDSTSSGIVVFPDNNDALFIENSYGMNTYLTINW